MGLFDIFRRKKGIESTIGDLPLGMGEEGEEGEGGPHFFRTEIAQLRLAAQGAAVEIANSDPDPLMWPDARLVFDAERAQAFAHEGLRDRLSNKVAAGLREVVGELYELAAGIASTRVRLKTVDENLARVKRSFDEGYREVEADPIELGRYYRHRDGMTRMIKLAIAMLFVVSELLLTYYLFAEAFGIDDQAQLLLFSVGLLTLFIVVPHYAAHGLKEGITRHHTHLRQRYFELKQLPPVEVNRNHHMEEQDDRGFKWAAGLSAVVLVMLIVPLSLLRGEELSNGKSATMWAALYFLLQLSISAYFFLREWLDHGYPSNALHKVEQAKDALESEREGLLEELADGLAEFNSEGQQIIFWVREAPRWDSYIVASYYQSIHYLRHLVATARPDLAPFVSAAEKPFLGRRADESTEPSVLNSVANEMPSLDNTGLFDRTWWMEKAGDALATLPAVQSESGEIVIPASGNSLSWVLSNSPSQILAGFLEMLGVPFHYRAPHPAELREPLRLEASLPVTEPAVAEPSVAEPSVAEPATLVEPAIDFAADPIPTNGQRNGSKPKESNGEVIADVPLTPASSE